MQIMPIATSIVILGAWMHKPSIKLLNNHIYPLNYFGYSPQPKMGTSTIIFNIAYYLELHNAV